MSEDSKTSQVQERMRHSFLVPEFLNKIGEKQASKVRERQMRTTLLGLSVCLLPCLFGVFLLV